MRIRTNLTLPVGLLDTIPAGERSRVVVAALVQYLDLDPLTFEPRIKPTDTHAAECKRTELRPEPELPTNLDDIDFAALDDEYPRTTAGYLPQYADMDPAD